MLTKLPSSFNCIKGHKSSSNSINFFISQKLNTAKIRLLGGVSNTYMVSDSKILSFKQIISSVVKWKFSGTFIINMGLLLLLCSLMQLKEISVFVNICTMAAFSEIYGESKVKT